MKSVFRAMLICSAALVIAGACKSPVTHSYSTSKGQILVDGAPLYFVSAALDDSVAGTVSGGRHGRDVLMREIDAIKSMGISSICVSLNDDESLSRMELILDALDARGMTATVCLEDSLKDIRRTASVLKESPALFAWYLCNSTADAQSLKAEDPSHIIIAGPESATDSATDCISLTLMPEEYGWHGIQTAIDSTDAYLDRSISRAAAYGKPIIIDAFCYPAAIDTIEGSRGIADRDLYLSHVLNRLQKSADSNGILASTLIEDWKGLDTDGIEGILLSDISTTSLIGDAVLDLKNTVRANVPVQHDWLFDSGEDCSLELDVSSNSFGTFPFTAAVVTDLSLMSEKQDTVRCIGLTADLSADKTASLDCSFGSLDPGFYQIRISYTGPDGTVRQVKPFNIGVSPERIVSPQDKQPDFDEFWSSTLAELAEVPLAYKITPLPDHSSESRNLYKVEFASLGGIRVGGYYAEPVKEGKYPVYIDYMGYSAAASIYDPDEKPDCIQFQLSVREQGLYDNGQDWICKGLQSKESYYYRGAFCDVVRAVDFIATRFKADQSRIFAQGASQGGAFTLIAASLDKRIRAAAPSVPFLGDFKDYSRIVGWPMGNVFEAARKNGISRDELFKTLSYFDVKNFVDRIECPIYMAFGLQDPTCPPHTNFAEYNLIRSDKKKYCAPQCGHAIWNVPEWDRIKESFFKTF